MHELPHARPRSQTRQHSARGIHTFSANAGADAIGLNQKAAIESPETTPMTRAQRMRPVCQSPDGRARHRARYWSPSGRSTR